MHVATFAVGLWLVFGGNAAAAEKAAGGLHVVEIVARAEVVTAPKRVTLPGGRSGIELQVTLDSYQLAPDQPKGADRQTQVDMQGRVRVQHDVGCGADEVVLAVGDRVDLKGEYVEERAGGDLIRFTHPPGAEGCGDKDHPDGYLRKVSKQKPTPQVTAPAPSGIVPDQPYVGTPRPTEKAYLEILRLKEAGASDAKLLDKIRTEKKLYPLGLGDIQKLKDAGVSQPVIEAMLQSGRGPVTPGRRATPTPTPAS